MGGSKPKAPKSKTTTIVKQPDAPDPIFFQTIVPKESYEDVEYDINFAQRRAGDLERASDMMGLSPQALGIQEAKTQAIQDAAYASSLPGGLSGSIYDVANKQAADSAANLEQVEKDAAKFDRVYADDNLYKFGPANRDDDWLKFSDAEAEGGGRRRRRRRDDDDDDGGRRRRGRKDDGKDKKDKKKKRKKAKKFSYYYAQRRHPEHYGPGSRLGENDPKFRVYRRKGGRTRIERVTNEEYERKRGKNKKYSKSDRKSRRKLARALTRRRRGRFN